MDIMLIGGVSSFANAIIDKFNKEGHRVYILTGRQYDTPGYKRVFETYKFEYDSDSMAEILDSVNPDVILFMGAYDSNFNWKNARKEAVRYVAALQNLLVSYANRKKGRLIYLSSHEVFQGSYVYDIPEEEPVTVRDFHALTIAQGEEMCLKYHQIYDMDIIVMRMDHVYDIPKKKSQVNNICAFMCLEALTNNVIPINGAKVYSLLYISDAVEFIHVMAACKNHKRSLYHLSSAKPINELQLAKTVKEAMGWDIEIDDNRTDEEHRLVLSNRAFDREFRIRIFNRVEETIKQMAEYMKRHRRQFLSKKEFGEDLISRLWNYIKGFAHAAVPFIENLVLFIPFFMLNNRAVGSAYFANLDIYLLYVLLFAIVHGQQQATLSAVLAVAGYFFRQMYDRSGFEVVLDYNTYVWIAQLFIMGLVVGYMRDQLYMIRQEGEREIMYISSQLEDIHDINYSNARMKNMLETQIVNQSDSLGKIYEITSALDKYEPEEVLFYAAEILGKLINSKDVAIYTVANRSYARLFSATSAQGRSLGNSINYTEYTDMYEHLKEKRVYINRNMDERYPVMANAIYAEDEMQLILMVWGVSWDRMTLGQANMLAVIGYLIQNAVLRANRFMEALEAQRYVAGTNILDTNAFSSLVRAYMAARRRNLTECAIIAIEVEREKQEEAGVVLGKLLRQTDFLGRLQDERLYAILANTDNQSASYVVRRFGDAGYECKVLEEVSV